MSDLGEEFAGEKICIQWLKKALVYICVLTCRDPPEFSPFRNFKKNIGKLNSLTVRKKKNKKIFINPTNFMIDMHKVCMKMGCFCFFFSKENI